jgi:hypothetical protein
MEYWRTLLNPKPNPLVAPSCFRNLLDCRAHCEHKRENRPSTG